MFSPWQRWPCHGCRDIHGTRPGDQVPPVGGLAFFVTNKSHKLFQRLGEGSINIWKDHGGTSHFSASFGCAIFVISYIWFIYDLYMIYICILYIYNTLIYLWVLMDFQAAPDSRLPPLMVDPTGSFSFVVQPVSASEQGRNPAAPLGEIHSLPWKITIFKKPHIGYIGKSSIKASIKHI